MKKLIFIPLITLLSACVTTPISTSKTDNPEVRLALVCTTPEGAKVYRFWDSGHFVYITVLPGATSYHTGGRYDQYIQNESTEGKCITKQ